MNQEVDVVVNTEKMFEQIASLCCNLSKNFDSIPAERKQLLTQLADYIVLKMRQEEPVNLVYVCTHNSRRSHFGQVWAAVAAAHYGCTNVHTFSGGTEATAFNKNAIAALKSAGFEITPDSNEVNAVYKVIFGDKLFTNCFSKVVDHASNPKANFAAIMTCSDADENCPFIPGVELRIGTTYEDPKVADGTPQQAEKYKERSLQIATECLYLFSRVHQQQKISN